MMNIREAGAALRSRKVSCEELVQEALRAEGAHRDLNAFLTVTDAEALKHAKRLDQELASGKDRGPLHGIPIAHKDLYFTAGVRTTNGSKIFADFVPDHDAESVVRLRESGAISIGKLNMHELAYGITSNNPHYGPVRNQRELDHIPGGSSGGSGAAVGAGIVFGATGSDTGGSIRIPASFCGVTGMKATYGRVSCDGCFPLGLSLDHMGPLARSVEDSALLLEAMAGMSFPVTPDAKVRIGVPQNFYFQRVQPEVREAVMEAIKRAGSMGAKIIPVQVPEPEELTSTARTLLLCEAATVMHPYMEREADFGSDVLALLKTGSELKATDYIRAEADASRLRIAWSKLFDKIDVLFTPTTPTVAPRIGQQTISIDGRDEDTRLLTTRFCRGINLLGNPAISIPCGESSDGLPIGLHIIGALNQDQTVLNVAAALQ
jgi:aspartyl-tRNA(Asn)/glutamyl-tRNA(Gln) amidotransferase subunit A